MHRVLASDAVPHDEEPNSDATPPPPAASAAQNRSLFVDLRPLRESPAFARLWLGGAISGIGGQMTIVAIGLQVYDLTRSSAYSVFFSTADFLIQ